MKARSGPFSGEKFIYKDGRSAKNLREFISVPFAIRLAEAECTPRMTSNPNGLKNTLGRHFKLQKMKCASRHHKKP